MAKKSVRDFSAGLRSQLKEFKLSPEQKAFADLVIMGGWADLDAYMVVGLFTPLFNTEANIDEMNRLQKSKAFQAYSKELEWKKAHPQAGSDAFYAGDKMSDAELAQAATKEEQLKQIYAAREKFTAGSKEWIDMTKLIADITQAKKNEIVEEEERIHFFLPIQCRPDSCPYMQYYKKKSSK